MFNQPENRQCLYFIACGLTIGLWNYGLGMFHCLLSILLTYLAVHFLKGLAMVGVVFAFNFTYLLVGKSQPSY